MLLFQFVGNGFQLALCSVGKLATQKRIPSSSRRSRCCSTARQALCHQSTHISHRPGRAAKDRQERRLPATSSRCGVVFLSVPCRITSPSAGRARRATSSQTKRYRTLLESCGSLSSEWEERKKSNAGSGSLCEPRKPRKTLAPTADEGWLSNP